MSAQDIPLRERRTLLEEWSSFLRVIPANAPVVQVVECRRAFYAGAQALFILMTGGLDADSEPTDTDLQYMDALSQELQQFANDVATGKA